MRDTPLHTNELAIDLDLVRRLVDGAFPDLAGLILAPLGQSGSSNRQFRLGDELLVRLPRQPGGGATIDKELRWTEKTGRYLPVSVPEIVGVGEPSAGYSERWSIVRWIEGELPVAGKSPGTLAEELADVVAALRGIVVSEAADQDVSLCNYRGDPLSAHHRQFSRNVEGCRTVAGLDLDLDAALTLWEDACAISEEAPPASWYHSDLVAENLLLTGGRLTGVLDFGGLGVGDPTVDLHGAWELFDARGRERFRTRLNVSDAQWLRGRAWALAISLMTFTYYWQTMPGRVGDRLVMARAVLAEV